MIEITIETEREIADGTLVNDSDNKSWSIDHEDGLITVKQSDWVLPGEDADDLAFEMPLSLTDMHEDFYARHTEILARGNPLSK